MFAVELFDVQKESFNSTGCYHFSGLEVAITFSIYITSLKGTVAKYFIKERSQTHASIS